MRFRIFVSLIAFLLTASLYAQSNELGVFVNQSSFSSTSKTDPATSVTGSIQFDSKMGYGISFNHYLSPNLSVQLSGQTVRGRARVTASIAGAGLLEEEGTIDLKQYDAALHWYVVPNGTFKPYVGAGVAWIGSSKLKSDPDPATGVLGNTVALENKTTWLADGGVDFSVSQKTTITLAAKYTHYTAKLNTTPDDLFQNLKLNPFTLAAGIRFKF